MGQLSARLHVVLLMLLVQCFDQSTSAELCFGDNSPHN